MKKTVFLFLISIVSFSLFAQTANKIETEYYGLKWGCSPAELKAKYPSAYSIGKNKDGDEVYCLDTNDAKRGFFFGNNKFYWGRIIYEDCTADKAKALLEKIVDTYGNFDISRDSSDEIIATKRYSSKITITVKVTMKDSSVMITYISNDLQKQISQDRINKMQDDLEI